MDALPQVGQKYQHKKWGEVEVTQVIKVGRGYQVKMLGEHDLNSATVPTERLKDFQKATA